MGATRLGFYDVPDVPCRHCGASSLHRVTVFGKYFSLKFIPMFPTGRTMMAECENCNKTIPDREFPQVLHQQYLPNKARVRPPWWHYIGAVAFGIIMLVGTCNRVMDSMDPRSKSMKYDIANMTSYPSEHDSISVKMSRMFAIELMGHKLDPTNFSYRTLIQGDNALILVSIPQLWFYEIESRDELMELIVSVAKDQGDLKDKNIYIGLFGREDLMVVRTPTFYKSDDEIAFSTLYEFYGK